MYMQSVIEEDGTVIKVLPSTRFIVELENEETVRCHLSDRIMRNNRIRIVLGDKVRLEMSPYDLTRGRIIYKGRY